MNPIATKSILTFRDMVLNNYKHEHIFIYVHTLNILPKTHRLSTQICQFAGSCLSAYCIYILTYIYVYTRICRNSFRLQSKFHAWCVGIFMLFHYLYLQFHFIHIYVLSIYNFFHPVILVLLQCLNPAAKYANSISAILLLYDFCIHLFALSHTYVIALARLYVLMYVSTYSCLTILRLQQGRLTKKTNLP